MSLRARSANISLSAQTLRSELDALKNTTTEVNAVTEVPKNAINEHSAAVEFEKLSPTEQAAASLGVSPESWRPIGWLNDRHFENLIAANAVDDTLARRIMAYREVSESEKAKK
jgi:hypothetical protein